MHLRRVAMAAMALSLAACGSSEPEQATAGGDPSPAADGLVTATWDEVLAAADGQTVDWWLYGGDARINAYIDDHVVPRAADAGVTLRRVPIQDTAEAVQRVADEVAAGESSGSVDLIWINGENFAAGAAEDLWLEGWADRLPNAAALDPLDATLTTDFGLDTKGRESPWSRAAFVYAHDPRTLSRAPADVEALLDWAEQHPGRFTYPAPPDFTGSAFVRQVVLALGEDEAMARLAEVRPSLWRGGDAFPVDEAELNQLFGDGQVDIAMSYNPAFVATNVDSGVFNPSARPFTLDDGVLSNVSFVTLPANAADQAGAMVVANLLLDPELQAIKADPDVLGVPTVLPDLEGPQDKRVLTSFEDLLPELPAAEVDRLEQRWLAEVLGS